MRTHAMRLRWQPCAMASHDCWQADRDSGAGYDNDDLYLFSGFGVSTMSWLERMPSECEYGEYLRDRYPVTATPHTATTETPWKMTATSKPLGIRNKNGFILHGSL